MKIFGGEVSIPSRHLEGRMAKDSTETIEVSPALNMPTCKSVADIVPAIVCDPSTRTCFAERVPEVAVSLAGVGIGEHVRALTEMRAGHKNGYSPIR
jgi:hypothetical protein